MAENFNAHTRNQSGDWHKSKSHLAKVARGDREFASKFKARQIRFYASLWHYLDKYNSECSP